MYDYQDFSKKDKARLRELVGVGAQNEAGSFLKETFKRYQSIMEKEPEDMRVPYWEINDKFKSFSKHLKSRYDNYSHSNLPILMVRLFLDGHLTEKHFADFSEGGREKLDGIKKLYFEK